MKTFNLYRDNILLPDMGQSSPQAVEQTLILLRILKPEHTWEYIEDESSAFSNYISKWRTTMIGQIQTLSKLHPKGTPLRLGIGPGKKGTAFKIDALDSGSIYNDGWKYGVTANDSTPGQMLNAMVKHLLE